MALLNAAPELEKDLAAALLTGADTRPIRARLASLRTEAAQAMATAAQALSSLHEDIAGAFAADASLCVHASYATLAKCIAQLQPPPPP